MKKYILSFMFFVMSLLSYAAFPTFFDADSSTYISYMSVDSFDVNMCLCPDCFDNKVSAEDKNSSMDDLADLLLVLSGIVLLGLIIYMLIFGFRWYRCLYNEKFCSSDSAPSGPNHSPGGVPTEVRWMAILGWISFLLGVPGLIIKSKRRK